MDDTLLEDGWPRMTLHFYPVSPLSLYVAKLALHFGKLAQQMFWKCVKKDAFSHLLSQISASGNEFGARTSPTLTKLVELAQAQKP